MGQRSPRYVLSQDSSGNLTLWFDHFSRGKVKRSPCRGPHPQNRYESRSPRDFTREQPPAIYTSDEKACPWLQGIGKKTCAAAFQASGEFRLFDSQYVSRRPAGAVNAVGRSGRRGSSTPSALCSPNAVACLRRAPGDPVPTESPAPHPPIPPPSFEPRPAPCPATRPTKPDSATLLFSI